MGVLQVFRFSDLKTAGLVSSWAQLGRLVQRDGFPPGRLLSARVRVWLPSEIEKWLSTRPTVGSGPRSAAKTKRQRKIEAALSP
jgi:hypothetical protein